MPTFNLEKINLLYDFGKLIFGGSSVAMESRLLSILSKP